MGFLLKIVNKFKTLAIFGESSALDFSQGTESTSIADRVK